MSDGYEKHGVAEPGLGRYGWPASIALMVIVLVFGALAYAGLLKSREVEVTLGDNRITIGGSTALTEVLQLALEKDEVETQHLMASRGFYHIESELLVDAIENIDSENETYATLRNGLRNILWNLSGPYSSDTLSGADDQFIAALVELDDALRTRQEVNELLAVLWERSIERERPFEKLALNARVEVLPEAPDGQRVIYACPQSSVMHDKYIKLLAPAEGGGDIEYKVEASEALFPCDVGAVPRVPDILGGAPARLAISTETARNILGPGREGPIMDSTFETRFLLRPAFLASSGLLEVQYVE